ncbi:hypothetical protein Tco_1495649 [Tanacetum coccineum]
MEDEGEAVRMPLNLRVSQKNEPFVPFSVKFPHFGSTSTAVRLQMLRRPALPAPAAPSPLTTSSNGVSVFNLGGPAAAHSSAAHNNNY